MRSKRSNFLFALAMLGGSVLACNWPGLSAPTPFAFPTPNLTLTTVFNQDQSPLPTQKLPAPEIPTTSPIPIIQATATVMPTATAIPATATATMIAPSATPAPTSTSVSYTGPEARQGASVAAAYMNSEPRIDGSFDEWNLERYPVTNVIVGGGSRNGESDLSGNFMVGWDENNLYIAARIRDDLYVQNASGENLFKGDSVEVLLDTNVPGDYYLDVLSSDDYQIGISPGSPRMNENPEAYLWYPQSFAGSYQKIKASTTPTDDGYRIEIKIPWNIVGVAPTRGRHLGFAFSISDNDNQNNNVQESMVSNVSTRKLTDPTTWGDLVLTGATNPQTRSGPSVTARFVESPQLDGSLGEWNFSSFSVDRLVYGADKWDSAADLSGTAMIGWDNTNLYLGVRVLDNRYIQNASGENIFLGDSLEILLDGNLTGDFSSRSMSGDDFQLGISPGTPSAGTAAEAYLWYPNSGAGSRTTVKIASTATADGYVVEVAVPWRLFGIIPEAGQNYGFALSISDNDNQNNNVQQSMVSNVATRSLTDPTTWGNLTLGRP